MGMFDTIIPEIALPDAPPAKTLSGHVVWWQTKDFDCPGMDNYKITADGRLLEEIVTYEDRSDPSAPEGSLERIRGMMTPVHREWRDMNYHGVLNFYGYAGWGDSAKGGFDPALWYEYNAKFTDGQLVSIEREPVRTPAGRQSGSGE